MNKVVKHLREVQRRGLWKTMGYKSIQEYCLGELKVDESETRELLIAIGEIITEDQMTDPNPRAQKRIEALRAWRKEKASSAEAAAYLILTNRTLLAIGRENPKSIDDLTKIPGIGPKKILAFGKSILKCLGN